MTGDTYRVRWHDGGEETAPTDRRDLLQENFRAYFRYLRGEAPRPLTRLVDARPFVHLYDLVLVAAQEIRTVPEEHVRRSPDAAGTGAFVAIDGIRDACEDFAATGRFPSEQGAAWGRPGGRASAADLPRLLETARRMAAEAKS